MTFLTDRPRLLGILTAWPLIYMVIFLVVWLIMFAGMFGTVIAAEAGAPPEAMPIPMIGMFGMMAVIMPLHLLTMVVIFGLLAFYIVHIVTNEGLNDTQKALWAVVCLMGGPIGQAIYFWQNIHNATPEAPDSGAHDVPVTP